MTKTEANTACLDCHGSFVLDRDWDDLYNSTKLNTIILPRRGGPVAENTLRHIHKGR
jgi:hypothetical protein